MPTFDYQCRYCGFVKEFINYKEKEEPNCPECEQKMQRLVSAPGLLRTNFHDKPSVRSRK